ncbi:MAG: alpha/beta hydrolase [Candidatus Heimdallarchaeota archaeon]|nr:alpha/beta hydrolase [Candidatus Heimdallarchaeota archaeon]
MQHNEGNFTGLNNNSIYYQNWQPENVKAVVLITHGFGEHSGRYMNVVDTLIPEGYAVWALDHRGHGKSEGKRNFVNRFTDYLQDVQSFKQIVRKAHPDIPLHLLGHSMGSIIANNYMALYADQDDFTTLILSGTGAAPGPGINGVTIILSKIFSVLLPGISIASGLDPNFISHDQAVIDAYINDPLVLFDKITPRLGAEMMKYLMRMNESASSNPLPTFLQIGSEDESFDPNSWQGLIDSFPNKDKKLAVYEGYRHEVYNEVEKQALIDLKDWLNAH